METKAISPETKSNLELLSKLDLLKQFYLAGGTACAIYFGHRISYDLDFFSEEQFDSRNIENTLREFGNLEVDRMEKDTFLGALNKIKISFFTYRYPLIDKKVSFLNIDLVSKKDLAAMKIDALQSRGTKRDFIDLYIILTTEKWTIIQALLFFQKKYQKANYNLGHIVKSLVYFDDADSGNEKLVMLKDIDWQKVKQFFINEIKQYHRQL